MTYPEAITAIGACFALAITIIRVASSRGEIKEQISSLKEFISGEMVKLERDIDGRFHNFDSRVSQLEWRQQTVENNLKKFVESKP